MKNAQYENGGSRSVDHIVRKSHAASRSSGLRAIADGLDQPEATISIWQVQECLRVAADKIAMQERQNAELRQALQDMVDTYEHEASMENESLVRAKHILANVRDHRCSPEASATNKKGNKL
jgi:hypothetical protein